MTNSNISRSLVEQVRVETPDDVIYFRKIPDASERWSISGMDGQVLGELSVERGYATVRTEGKIIFQNDGSNSPDRFDEKIDQEAAMSYIAEHIREFRRMRLRPKPRRATEIGMRARIQMRMTELGDDVSTAEVLRETKLSGDEWLRVLRGDRGLSGKEVEAIARTLFVSTDWLTLGEEPFPVVALSRHGYRMPPGV